MIRYARDRRAVLQAIGASLLVSACSGQDRETATEETSDLSLDVRTVASWETGEAEIRLALTSTRTRVNRSVELTGADVLVGVYEGERTLFVREEESTQLVANFPLASLNNLNIVFERQNGRASATETYVTMNQFLSMRPIMQDTRNPEGPGILVEWDKVDADGQPTAPLQTNILLQLSAEDCGLAGDSSLKEIFFTLDRESVTSQSYFLSNSELNRLLSTDVMPTQDQSCRIQVYLDATSLDATDNIGDMFGNRTLMWVTVDQEFSNDEQGDQRRPTLSTSVISNQVETRI